ncbi:glycerol kinase GlpK [Massilia sp. PWRC2]|uniref:glycerol kinase GlpK n=1 Tax=Massilia sp. PWRC2 TaxID=2804626 RepID=UPI003CF93533
MSKYILALDQGTTSSRAILFDRHGRPHACAQQELRQIYPQPGWVEHDANDIWTAQLAVARQLLREHAIDPAEIAAIGIANQRETTVLWDRASGEPLANAIVWQDRRNSGLCERLLEQGHGAQIQHSTGLVVDAYFSATKLVWLLDNIAGARARAERGELAFGTIDCWLTYKFSGAHVTDTSNAARTMLFDITALRWDPALLELFNIPPSLLPTVVPSSAIAAHSHAELLGRRLPIAGIAGDQQAATFGQACLRPGMAKNTYGTGCFILMNVGSAPIVSRNRLLSTVGWSTAADTATSTSYLLEGSAFVAGAAVQWMRDGLGIISHAAQVETLANSVPDTGGVMFVPAFAGLGAPYWDPHARGTLVGITRGTNRAHIARAALEGVAYQNVDVLRAMQDDADIALAELRVDGGGSRNDLMMQFQADILNVAVVRPVVTETTALGAAYLAGLAVGFWASQEEIASQWQVARRFEPRMGADERQGRLHNWQRAVDRSRLWNEGGAVSSPS